MIAVDVNVLVYAHRADASRHLEFRQWLEGALNAAEPVAVADLVLSGALRVLTHPRVFDPPTPLVVAMDQMEAVRHHPRVVPMRPGDRHWGVFADLCRHVDARGNLVPDAYLAALAIEHGCEWVTTDRDFARFPGLRWRHPLPSPS